MGEMSKLRTLCLFKTDFCCESYMSLYIPQRLRSSLAKFRVGSHDLKIECGRHRNVPTCERLCKLCLTLNMNYVEDEYHVIMQCPFYDELRAIYLNVNEPKNLHTFISIMSVENDDLVRLACFIYNMFKVRKSLLSQLVVVPV